MNDKDKELINGSRMKQMNDRIEDLITENKKLREALEKAHEDFTKQGLHKQASIVMLALNITTVREALKEVEDTK